MRIERFGFFVSPIENFFASCISWRYLEHGGHDEHRQNCYANP
jgi:hypothetical protein